MRVPNTSKSVLRALSPLVMILLLSVLGFGLPNLASAITTPSGDPAPFLRTICDGNCGDFGFLDERRMDAGFADDFSLGLSLIRNGLDLTLKSDGNILIFGALSAAGSIEIRSDATIDIGGGAVVTSNDLTLRAGFHVDDLFFRPTNDATLTIRTVPECDCSVLSRGFGDIRLRAGDLQVTAGPPIALVANLNTDISINGATLVAAVTGVDAIFPKLEPSSEVFVYREGDIYIDVSRFEFQNLKVIAGQSIVFVSSDSTPVPEPGTALLLGLGLTMLASRRPKNEIQD